MLISAASARRTSGVFLVLGQLLLQNPLGTQIAFVVKLTGPPQGPTCAHSPGPERYIYTYIYIS